MHINYLFEFDFCYLFVTTLGQGELVWDASGEREAQERARRRTEERRGQPLTWDDADEKACMEMYRKKYS